jgi:protein-L-isoaspartate(D-aspartate) O-methyltransferase
MAYLLASLLLGDDPEEAKQKDVLEIGTGSGYQAAILAERCRSVVSIDVCLNRSLSEKLPSNVALIAANGYEYDTQEEFDGVLVAFAAQALARSWGLQLKQGARLVVPVMRGNSSAISVYERQGEELNLVDVPAYAPFTKGVEA